MHRSTNHKIIAGVCGGIAESIGWSPTVVRVLWLLLSLLPGPMWVLYLVMWVLVPKAPRARY
ncbi:PspC domain-containing protein [Streptosporangium sp. NPDC006007]|uniref:PspC domain-containing protein n=1 Tax=Streptosporangium sp. NPDC006007 TaxID=3154575 RepID=UPI0033BCA195